MNTKISQSNTLAMCPAIYLGPSGILMWAPSPYFLCKPPSLEFCIFSLSLISSTPQPISLSSLLAISVARSWGVERRESQCLVYWTPWEVAARFGSAEQLRNQHPAVFLYLRYPQNTTSAFSVSSIIPNCTRQAIRDSHHNN